MIVARNMLIPVAFVVSTSASAHHPGSHAARQPDGRVRLEVVATVPDTCTRIADIAAGSPSGVAAAPGTAPVTVRLVRSEGACEAQVGALDTSWSLDAPGRIGTIMVYVLGTDGTLAATERVPIE